MRLTRRELIAGTAGAALAAGGIYELADHLTASPEPGGAVGPREQHELQGLRVVENDGVEVVVPPLFHQVVTATVVPGTQLADARSRFEDALASIEDRAAVTVAWGLPYFRRHVAALAGRHVPTDLRASETGRPVKALLDARRFPSDPPGVILEANDVAALFRGDVRRDVDGAAAQVFGGMRDVFAVTSIRKGFVGGGFSGGVGLPKRMAVAAGIDGADLIPDTAELFLGLTSTQKASLGPHRIANLETLGYTDAAGGYFEGGTHMHLSHIRENLAAWYLNFDHGERIGAAFRPGLGVAPGVQTVAEDRPADVAAVEARFRSESRIGHSASIQTVSRLGRDTVAADGTIYRRGTSVPQRADFNTLDNPFFWSSRPEHDRMEPDPAAGVHFVIFNPTSDDFHRTRLAMDGVLPDGTRLPLPPRGRGQGFNAVLATTHRQNFLVPPRAHRSFPLSELLD
ncbi:MAG TPA: hypothetical protein VFU10_12635 [Gaiellaceae bacterium]|nr:hypothetical protein [Gaiellaceae bacterium]